MRFSLNNIYKQDCIEGMKEIPNDSVDLIVADPPYNLGKDFGLSKKDRFEEQAWLPWSKKWLDQAKRILKPGGNIFVYGIHKHLCWLQCYMFEIGLTYQRQIIWYYENGFAGYSKRTLAANYEPILWFSKGDGYTYHTIRVPYKSQNRLKYKIVKNGKTWRPNPEGKMEGDVWKFPVLAGKPFQDEKVDHPTQKPLSITSRIIEHFSNEGDLVVIPFVGSGTECLACLMAHRNFLGFELNSDYINIANNRIKKFISENTNDSKQ